MPALSGLQGSDQAQALLERVAALSLSFSKSLNIQETLDHAVVQIVDLMQAEAASIFLIDQHHEMLVCRASHGPVDVRGLKIPMDQGVIGRALQSQQPQVVADVASDPDFTGHVDKKTGFTSRTMVCSPLLVAHGAIGVIQVLNKRDGGLFDPTDALTLKMLSVPVAMAIHNAQLAMELVEQKRIQRELKIAREMQKDLLPRRVRPPFPIQAVTMPAREVSGDFYDYFTLDNGHIRFTIGDVSGKGLDASLLMMRTSTLLRWVGKQGLPPDAWLAAVNDELAGSVGGGMFICAVVGEYDPATGMLCWANAGFLPLLKYNPVEGFHSYPASGPPLAVLPGSHYENEQVHLDNQLMLLFSDGVTESRERKTGQMLELEGLQALIAAQDEHDSPERRMRKLLIALRRRRMTDDTTLMLIADRCRQTEPLVEFGYTADAANLKVLRNVLRDALESIGADEQLIGQMQLVVNEASANILRHAYQGDPGGRIVFSLLKKANQLEFVFQDFAPCVDCERIRPRDLSECRPGGLGINLIDSLMDEWYFQPLEGGQGNLLIMRKHYDTRKPL